MPSARGTKPINQPFPARRRDAIVPELGHDPYRLAGQFSEPTVCTGCGARYHRGRWTWGDGKAPPKGAAETVCPACRRMADDFCAGELIVSGAFVAAHRADIDALMAAEAKAETDEHPLNRVARTEASGDGFRVLTTDVHLARRLGEALEAAYEGTLDITYPPDAETVRVVWDRQDIHEPAAPNATAQIPIAILGEGMDVPPEAEGLVQERIGRLRRFHGRIMSCRVTIEAPQGHHRQGGPYAVSIRMEVPGPDIVINRQQADDLRVAVRLAFEAAQRKLEDLVRKMRPEAPREDDRTFGRISRLLLAEGYGFLEGEDGHDVYFHANSVLGVKFEGLSVGERVRYVEEMGDNGPQATSVLARAMSGP